MELRNRRLSGEEHAEEQEQQQQLQQQQDQNTVMPEQAIQMKHEELVDDERRSEQAKSASGVDSDEEMDVDDAGGFLGDFEEIDEDEAIEMFLSQNHTPVVSTRQSPEALQMAEDSSDGEDSFEPIPEKTMTDALSKEPEQQVETAALVNGKEDDNRSAKTQMVVEQPESLIPDALSTSGSSGKDEPGWKVLEDQFRDKFVPKLPPSQFFQAEIYKQYSVVNSVVKDTQTEVPAETHNSRPTTADPPLTEAPLAAPVPVPVVQQKPSSLRTANNNNNNNNNSGNGTEPQTQSTNPSNGGPATSTRARATTAIASKQDDVVGALLGVMQSPTKKAEEPQPEQPSQIPSDVLAAMMAIDGMDVGAKRPAPATTNIDTHRQLAKELANRLPQSYSGPFSQLTLEEHARYLFLAQRIRRGKEQTEFQRLKQRVESEQREFRAQIKEKTMEQLRMIEPWVETAARGQLMKQREQALESYSRFYVPASVTAIRSIGSGHIPFVYKKTLAQRGICYGACSQVPDKPLEDPWKDDGQNLAGQRAVMTRDPAVRQLAMQTQADVALSDSALIALLTLQKMHMHDVLVPLQVTLVDGRRLVVVDRPLVVGKSATPRKMRQLAFDAAVRRQMVERSNDNKLALGPSSGQQSQPMEPDASYTLWEFGGIRLLVRCGIHAFSGEVSGDNSNGPTRTTVTLASKLEYFTDSAFAEVALASGGGTAVTQEDTSECDRLAWWLAAFLRGSPSQVWVTHVAPGAQPTRISRLSCADLFPPNTPQPPTHALRDVLAELTRLVPGKYMLQHRRGAWDATILRAVDGAEAGAGMDLAAELDVESETPTNGGAATTFVDADYVPPVWHGLPAQIPWTYPPADLADERGPQQTQHKKRRTGGRVNKRKNKKR
ncbi:hypothetical protein GGF39_002396 [Coemansia sp. RSA 1721]|nr:hypothetical protein GGF39_002396 [Coemansia sp. RSA 1721]